MADVWAWMDPGDGTLVPVQVLGRSLWPGTWRVRDHEGNTHLVYALLDNQGNVWKP